MLGWFDDPRAWRRIAELCAETHNVRARRDALRALLWTDHPQTRQLIHRALDDPHRKVRRLAERSIELLDQLDRLLPGQHAQSSKIF
jgi:HEAT repeat protein